MATLQPLPSPPPAPQPALPPTGALRVLPDYLPARMVNEFVYCPRLFFLEWVDGVFRASADTEEGHEQHKKVDKPGRGLPAAKALAKAADDESAEAAERIHSRSVTLSSERLHVIAKLDLVEAEGGFVTPVDYKHGKPRESADGALELWDADRAQLGVQGIVLRENGYRCDEGLVYYAKTRQRVRVVFDEAEIAQAEAWIHHAWNLARLGEMPPPLVDSPKCVGCSLAPICLPGETNFLGAFANETPEGQLSLFSKPAATASQFPPRKPPTEVRLLAPARDELRPLYLNTQGFRVGKSGGVLQVKDSDKVVQEVRIGETNQVNLLGNIQISTQALQTLLEAEVPVSFFSQGGWFYGIASGLSTKNVFLRQTQFRSADQPWFCLNLSRRLVAGKIRNQRTMLLRNHVEPPEIALEQMRRLSVSAESAESLEQLLGIEGAAARLYFGDFAGMLKADDPADSVPEIFRFDFDGRNRRPPRDAVNALLSLGYSMLAKDLTIACAAIGFDPMLGFYHQPRFGRPALALDLMEPFRPLIVDSAVISAINTRMVAPSDFLVSGGAVALTPSGRKGFFRAYELRMDTLATHPLFNYRVSYRRMLEIQSRLLGKLLEGEIGEYPVFVTR